MSKLSSLMVMIGICAFLGNKPAWASPASPPVIVAENSAQVQLAPGLAEQLASPPSLIVVGAAVAGGFGLMALRRKSA
jgi:hypothetical protein